MAGSHLIRRHFLIFYSSNPCILSYKRIPKLIQVPQHRNLHKSYKQIILRKGLFHLTNRLNPKVHSVLLFSTCTCNCNTHYDVLGIDRTASPKEIREAYIKLGKECHPDLHQNLQDDESSKQKIDSKENEELTNKFQIINEAYEVLGNKELRKKYDLTLPEFETSDCDTGKVSKRQGHYRSFDTFEERAEHMYGYKVDPKYYDKNPDRYKMAGICVLSIIFGYIVHYLIAKMSAQKQSRWLDENTVKYNQQLALVRQNAEKRGKLVKGSDEYNKILASFNEEVRKNKEIAAYINNK